MKSARITRRRGFTLIEILIVVIILGILAAIVIPQFSSASKDARKANVQTTVQTLRSQVALYKLQHNDRLPGGTAGVFASATFWTHMTTKTDADGVYQFTGLRPGTYSVREHQPTEYFDGGERIGSVGGQKHDVAGLYSIFTDINLGSGVNAIQYDFCEKPGAELSGYVFVDGAPIPDDQLTTPDDVADLKDGRRTADDRPLAGIVLELRHGRTGQPILMGDALPGHYTGNPDSPMRAVTDANRRRYRSGALVDAGVRTSKGDQPSVAVAAIRRRQDVGVGMDGDRVA